MTGRDNVPVDCTRHRLMTHLFTQVKLLKKLQKLAGEVLVALGAPQGDSWAPRAKFFALEPSNWTPASINQALHDTEWDSVFRGIDLCDSWDILAEKINEYIGSYVPVSRSSNEAYKNKTPKSRRCIDAINNKHRKWLK